MYLFIPKTEPPINSTLDTKIYPYHWQGKTILVVEDDEPNFKYFEFLLKEVDAKVLWAKNGLDAIEICCSEDQQVDLVLMDVLIPFVNGSDATREIRKYYKELPIIAISAYDTFDNRERCFLAGCNEFISKPVLPEKLLETMACYLEPIFEFKPTKEKVSISKPKLFKG